ncbi:hypothetical protein J4Q44_G00311630 [Coregonus suidteri]|uniref:DNA polymerase alpha subunit B n=1 Tax=Coregonus suidteri TaxID=861788 RepID=A0AAN8KUJ8_9TELE
MVIVACGPYTPSDGLTFDTLVGLINVIVRDRPDVCILLGPFVDSKHQQIEKSLVTETFDAIFSRCVGSIVEGTKGVGCQLIFVPSQRDVHHHLIYSQHPFTLPNLCKDDVKDVIGCGCVKPGRLTKGQVGRTYGRLLIQRSSILIDGKRVSPCVASQVVKI